MNLPTAANLLSVMIGGAAGATMRLVVNELSMAWSRGLPLGTLLCNYAGSAAIGWCMAHASEWSPAMRTFLIPGILGGLTTMSSFAFEMAYLAHERRWALAMSYGGLTIVGCTLLAWIFWRWTMN